MAIPTPNDFMLLIIRFLSDCKQRSNHEIIDNVSIMANLTDDDLTFMTLSGNLLYKKRIGWAITWLSKTKLIKQVSRGLYSITDRGLQALKESPNKIDRDYLRKYPEFNEFYKPSQRNEDEASRDEAKNTVLDENTRKTITDEAPEETIEKSFNILRSSLSSELIDVVKSISPQFFERLVIDLLLRMGYGGSREEAGKAVGKAGDGGIDGVINEDRLGLDKIFIQAKRWEGSVGRPIVQAFVGSLSEHHAKKGILITTSSFTKDAKQCVEKVEHQVSLIDGEKLVELMIEHNLGVNTAYNYEIKKIDRDYFSEEDI